MNRQQILHEQAALTKKLKEITPREYVSQMTRLRSELSIAEKKICDDYDRVVLENKILKEKINETIQLNEIKEPLCDNCGEPFRKITEIGDDASYYDREIYNFSTFQLRIPPYSYITLCDSKNCWNKTYEYYKNPRMFVGKRFAHGMPSLVTSSFPIKL